MSDDEGAFTLSPALRQAIYLMIIIASVASCLGRVVNVRSKDGRGPFLSANDRSRWCMIRAIVDSNTFVIDKLQRDKQWQTIDKVRHENREGELHYYSSKPPLFPTMVAGEYWLLKKSTGIDFAQHPFHVARTLLVITNILPLAAYFWLLIGLIERWGDTDWGRVFAAMTACWGTYLSTFAVTLNNHLPAAICTLVALHAFIRIWYDDDARPRYFVACGLAAAFAAANELPALSLLGLLGSALLWKDWRRTVLFGVPAVLLVAVAFFAINYVAHDSLRPPYMHREPGANWYDYPGSHWTSERTGVDAGEPSKAVYAFHSLVGHHGIFSLTPVWCLSVAGVFLLAQSRRAVPMPTIAWGIAILSLVCLTFYLFLRPEIDRNYGGVTSGFRWMFWFTPLWIFAMVPAVDQMALRRSGRVVGYAMLAVSVFSVSYPSANPWQHPWAYALMAYFGLPV